MYRRGILSGHCNERAQMAHRKSRTHNRSAAAPGITATVLSVVLFLFVSIGACRADIMIKFDDLKDGDKISDVAPVIVRADSSDGVDKVEFAVDDQLRFSTGSTPYTFKWDTIADTEGAHTLSVTAIDANGNKKTVTLKLTIDNEIALGADALAKKSREALDAKDLEAAYRYSRRSLKAEPDNVDASRSLAAYLGAKSTWDKAIAILEKAKGLEKSPEAMLELAGYRMHKAFLPENAPNIALDIESAIELRKRAAALNLERLLARNLPGDKIETHETIGDAYINAGKFDQAALEYQKSSGGGALSSVNRLALAYVLGEQSQQAVILLRGLVKDKSGDAASRAVLGLAYLRLRRFAEARELVTADAASGSPAALIVAAYADAVLGRATALENARAAVEAAPASGEAHYALSMAIPKAQDSEVEVIDALARSPFQYGPLVDFAARYSLATDKPDRFETAIKLLDIVLKNDADNRSAKLSKAMILLYLKRVKEAEPLLSELVRRDAQSADVQAAAAVYFDVKENPTAVNERLKQARLLDEAFFTYSAVPKPMELLFQTVRRRHYRGGFFVSPATLYPIKASK